MIYNYIFKPCDNIVLILHQVLIYFTNELNDLFEKYNSKYIFNLNGFKSYIQCFYKLIYKLLKGHLYILYNNY